MSVEHFKAGDLVPRDWFNVSPANPGPFKAGIVRFECDVEVLITPCLRYVQQTGEGEHHLAFTESINAFYAPTIKTVLAGYSVHTVLEVAQ